MAEHSDYQKGVIRRYYDNRQVIALARLGELVSELYLAESDRGRERLWERVESAMARLGVPESIAAHILARRDVEVLAANLADWTKSPPKE
jgi:hypothetical protein